MDRYIKPLILLIILNIFVTIVLFYLCWKKADKKFKLEGFENEEALQDLASVLNTGEMTVNKINVNELNVSGNTSTSNLNVKKDLTVTGNTNIDGKMTSKTGKIGLFEIRNDRIGIPNRGDLWVQPSNQAYWSTMLYDNESIPAGVMVTGKLVTNGMTYRGRDFQPFK